MIPKRVFFLLLGLAVISCRKDDVIIIEQPKSYFLPDVIYAGIFTATYPTDTFSNATELELNGTFFSNPKSPDTYPLGGTGALEVTDDTLVFDQNTFWPAIYDWQLYLDGVYAYTWDGIALHFVKEHGGNSYRYDLELQ